MDLKPAVAALRSNNYEEVKKYANAAREAYGPASTDVAALTKLQFDVADAEYKAALGRYETMRLVSVATLLASIAILGWLAMIVVRSITRPLNQVIDIFAPHHYRYIRQCY